MQITNLQEDAQVKSEEQEEPCSLKKETEGKPSESREHPAEAGGGGAHIPFPMSAL